MQRVRIGLTGLAFVFVLVLLGAVFTRATEDRAGTFTQGEQQANDASVAGEKAEPKEPLAELGVAPGNADNNKSEGAAGRTGAAAPAR